MIYRILFWFIFIILIPITFPIIFLGFLYRISMSAFTYGFEITDFLLDEIIIRKDR
jgi:hypothetical protein